MVVLRTFPGASTTAQGYLVLSPPPSHSAVTILSFLARHLLKELFLDIEKNISGSGNFTSALDSSLKFLLQITREHFL